MADSVFVTTRDEQDGIKNAINGIKTFGIVPNIHKLYQSSVVYTKRKNICFVGNFGTHHNVDAVRYFINEIFTDVNVILINSFATLPGAGSRAAGRRACEAAAGPGLGNDQLPFTIG